MEFRAMVLVFGSLLVLSVICPALSQSYYDKYGPGSTYRRPAPRPAPRPSGGGNRMCPDSLNEFDRELDHCMQDINRLSSHSTMNARCRAYAASKPCVEGLQGCSTYVRNKGRSQRLKKWEDMKLEAEIYGLCSNV